LSDEVRTETDVRGDGSVAKLVDVLAAPPAGVEQEIDPSDVMHTEGARERYFEHGASALRAIRLALLATGHGEPRRILDFPCGHGRVLRMLKAAFPAAALTAGDLNRGGVEFCQRKFGATPIYSSLYADEVEIDDQFDLVWCGSLLTHLDRDRWGGFFSLLVDSVANGGLFVFTAFGRYPAERIRTGEALYQLGTEGARRILEGFDRDGFGYSDYEGMTMSGMTLTSPAWTCARVTEREDLQLVSYTERAWFGHQDVIAVTKLG
jgi:SAM-dependent methyltransferase